jgi:anti-sigma factor RsiW
VTAEAHRRYRRAIDRLFALLGDLSQEAVPPERAAPHLREMARLCMSECYYIDLMTKEK